jgi:hypothetical protein
MPKESKFFGLSKPALGAAAILMAITIATGFASSWILLKLLPRETLVNLGTDPPLYSLREDVVRGACAAVGLLLSVGVYVAFFRAYSKELVATVIGLLAYYVNPIGLAAYIFIRTRHLFDTQNAIIPWTTFEEYAVIREYAAFLTMGAFLGVFLFLWLKKRREKNQSIKDSGPNETGP